MQHSLTLLAAMVVAASTGQAAEPDLRCTRADAAMVERMRTLLDDPGLRPTVVVYHAMTKMTLARIDCRRGRVERGLATYSQIDALLAAQSPNQVAAQ